MRRRRIAAGLLLIAAALAVAAGTGPDAPAAAGDPPPDQLVQPGENASYVWPYTSRRPSVDGRTLALNVVVLGDDLRVRRALTQRSPANWSRVQPEDEDDPLDPLAEPPWRRAHGSARYTYVSPSPGAEGQWMASSYQLGVGNYLGRQVHIRAYATGNATALQAHTEYWDWFRLRHTVTGIAPATEFVERDLRDVRLSTEVRREYHGLTGGRSDGWLSVIELRPPAGAAPLLALAAVPPVVRRVRTSEPEVRAAAAELALPVALAGIVLGVRGAGIALEGLAPELEPKYWSAVLYPVLALGPPAAIRRLAPGRDPFRAALAAGGGFGAGLVLDLGLVGVEVVPVDLVLQRTALVAALALVAHGVAGNDRRAALAGLAAWLGTLAATLLGLV